MRAPLAICAACLVASACADPAGVVSCAPLGPGAIAVTVRDSVTGAIVADSAHGAAAGVADLGMYSLAVADSLIRASWYPFADSVLYGGMHVGVFEVRIDRPGYQTWRAAGVRTRTAGTPCAGWVTQSLTARLQH